MTETEKSPVIFFVIFFVNLFCAFTLFAAVGGYI
jgi:hypothetical protein